ncbi:MAG: rRNA maturation RNase YbeY [Bacillota bacterium]
MPVEIANLQEKVEVPAGMIAALDDVVRAGLVREGLDPSAVEASIALVDDERIRELNSRYRGVDSATDVLSFTMGDGEAPGEPALLGDVVISLETASRQTHNSGELLSRTMLLAVHGLLHLLGYDHETGEDAKEMQAHEREILAKVALRGDGSDAG